MSSLNKTKICLWIVAYGQSIILLFLDVWGKSKIWFAPSFFSNFVIVMVSFVVSDSLLTSV